ncbi:MAG TPA: hypothetical protein VHZ03_00070 [Trebonia sp.]|nr:hypothetical protein [Trebonia sp.]
MPVQAAGQRVVFVGQRPADGTRERCHVLAGQRGQAQPAIGGLIRLAYRFDRHAPGYRDHFGEITRDMQAKCPVAWSDTYDGHWVASGYQELFGIARRADVLSSDHDPKGERRGYKGVTLPESSQMRSGFIEMDPPEQRMWRQSLNPYLSPAAAVRWKPFVNEITRAAIDERIKERLRRPTWPTSSPPCSPSR